MFDPTGYAKRCHERKSKDCIFSDETYSCRWPFRVFFNILDLAGINVWVLYGEKTGEKISRKLAVALFQLAAELAATYQESGEEEIIAKLPTNINLDSHVRKTCKIKYCKSYENLFEMQKTYVCRKCTFENKIACRKCSEDE